MSADADRTPAHVPLFRAEAIAHHAARSEQAGLLRLTPRWQHWAFWLLVATVASGLLYGSLGTVRDYAEGVAVVRIEGRVDVTTPVAGTVAEVPARPGEHVQANQILARFESQAEETDFDSLDKEFDLQLIRVMRDPADVNARQSLTTLRAQRDLAAAHVEERTLRAPKAGIVSDLRVRPGQRLAAGELVLTLTGDGARATLVAVMPGQDRPSLRAGEPLRFELEGYRYHYQELRIESVADDVIGPNEVRRYLGPDVADTLSFAGPLVLVRARLPERGFVSDGKHYDYYDGLPGRAQVPLHSEPIIVWLIPGLKGALHAR